MQTNTGNNSFVLKTAEGKFVGYLNVKKDLNVTTEQVSKLLNSTKTKLVVETPESQEADNPFV